MAWLRKAHGREWQAGGLEGGAAVFSRAPAADRPNAMKGASFVTLVRGRQADIAADKIPRFIAAPIVPNAAPPTVEPEATRVAIEAAIPRPPKLFLINEGGDLDSSALRTAAGQQHFGL